MPNNIVHGRVCERAAGLVNNLHLYITNRIGPQINSFFVMYIQKVDIVWNVELSLFTARNVTIHNKISPQQRCRTILRKCTTYVVYQHLISKTHYFIIIPSKHASMIPSHNTFLIN